MRERRLPARTIVDRPDMFARLIVLFTLVPIIELALLIQTGRWIGLWPTLGIVVATGVVGAALASREGLQAWRDVQLDLWEGRIPTRPVLDGLSVFVGGALLLTPGLLTDALGFFLLIRPTRRWLQNRVVNRFGASLVKRAGGKMEIHTFRAGSGWTRRDKPSERPERPEGTGRPGGREIG